MEDERRRPTVSRLPRRDAAAAPSVAETPPSVPGFEVAEEIGRGGMGCVYRALESATGREVAIKWIPATVSEGIRRRFERESRVAASIAHPNVVSVLGSGAAPLGSYIVMELVRGFALSRALDMRALGARALMGVIARTARALEAVHARGIVHRDVKPANVLIEAATGEPKLADFGLARWIEAASGKGGGSSLLTKPGVAMGTIGYIAPEILSRDARAAVPASDVFSLGVVLYEGLTGKPPFGTEPLALLPRVARGDMRPLPGSTPPLVVATVKGALAAAPEARPAAGALAASLERALL
jgi:serine/threonine-protein kinase